MIPGHAGIGISSKDQNDPKRVSFHHSCTTWHHLIVQYENYGHLDSMASPFNNYVTASPWIPSYCTWYIFDYKLSHKFVIDRLRPLSEYIHFVLRMHQAGNILKDYFKALSIES